MPTTTPSKAIRNIVLATLLTNGGEITEPTVIYSAVGSVFPSMTRNFDDLTYAVRWTRMSLANEGFIAPSKTRGTWTLTAKGRKAARAFFLAN